jgi:hypothetical protein
MKMIGFLTITSKIMKVQQKGTENSTRV